MWDMDGMSHANITIRNERANDYDAILRLTYEAFLTLDYPGRRRVDEHFLIYLLKNSTHVIPELCFFCGKRRRGCRTYTVHQEQIQTPGRLGGGYRHIRSALRTAKTPQAEHR